MIQLQRNDEIFDPVKIADVLSRDLRFVFRCDDMRGKYADFLAGCLK